MPLIYMKDMLQHAYHNGYAVGAFEVASLDFLDAIIAAAESARAPVILSLDESHFEHSGFELIMPAVEAAALRANVPVAIQLNHGASLDAAVKAIRLGCNGVMQDASRLTLGENLSSTRAIVEMAHACGVAVEGELGCESGGEGDDAGQYSGAVSHTTLAEAKGFVARTGVDFLAVSIGNVHDRMKDKPKLDWSRLKEINAALGIPLVIHGGAGLTDDQFRKLITLGVAKINCHADLAELAGNNIRTAAKSGAKGYTALLDGVRTAVSAEVQRCMRVWGSTGRAAEVLAQCRPWLNVAHVVVFNAPGLDGEKLCGVMTEGQRQLSTIPGVRKVEVGSVAGKSARYRHCWLIRFASNEVIDSYRQHPAHVAFADRLFRPVAADRLTADYIVTGVGADAIAAYIFNTTAVADTPCVMAREKI